MNHTAKKRFEELAAGRALGGLDAAEQRELVELSTTHGFTCASEFDDLATALEIEAATRQPSALPSRLASSLSDWAAQIEHPQTTPSGAVPSASEKPSAAGKILLHPLSRWILGAAAVIALFAIPYIRKVSPEPPIVEQPGSGPVEIPGLPFSDFREYQQVKRGGSLELYRTIFAALGKSQEEDQSMFTPQRELRLTPFGDPLEFRGFTFIGQGEYQQAKGEAVWSYLDGAAFVVLEGLPANDPKTAQYQLWIVDAERGADSLIDGGVFDIPASNAFVVIPIGAKPAVSEPASFLITLEQPGGVVQTKQEVVVAITR